MKILITGSTGFIGSHLTEALYRDHEVACLVRAGSHTAWLKQQPVHIVTANYQDVNTLTSAVKDQDVVFHLAARIQAPDWDAYHLANTQAVENMLRACSRADSGLKRFVFVSSISAAGPSQAGRPRKESDENRPASDYGRSKLAAEKIVMDFANQLPVVIIRPPNVLGERQKELESILQALKHRIMPSIGVGRLTSLIFVRDLIRALILVAQDERAIGKTYFVTNPEPQSWQNLLERLAREIGVSRHILKIPYSFLYTVAALLEWTGRIFRFQPPLDRESLRLAQDYNWVYDSRAISQDLGFQTRIGIEQGLQEIVAHYRSVGRL